MSKRQKGGSSERRKERKKAGGSGWTENGECGTLRTRNNSLFSVLFCRLQSSRSAVSAAISFLRILQNKNKITVDI